jgi:hypothetical protein
MMMLTDPLAGRQLEEEATVEAAVGAEVNVLDNRRLAQSGLAQAAGKPLVLAAGRLTVDEEPEPIFATEFTGIGGVLQSGLHLSGVLQFRTRPAGRHRAFCTLALASGEVMVKRGKMGRRIATPASYNEAIGTRSPDESRAMSCVYSVRTSAPRCVRIQDAFAQRLQQQLRTRLGKLSVDACDRIADGSPKGACLRKERAHYALQIASLQPNRIWPSHPPNAAEHVSQQEGGLARFMRKGWRV